MIIPIISPFVVDYPLVNIQKTMEKHHFYWINMDKSTINGHFQQLITNRLRTGKSQSLIGKSTN